MLNESEKIGVTKLWLAIQLQLRNSLVDSFGTEWHSDEHRKRFRAAMDGEPPDPDRVFPLENALRFAEEHAGDFADGMIRSLMDFELRVQEEVTKMCS